MRIALLSCFLFLTAYSSGAEIQLAVSADCAVPFRVLASPSGRGGYELSFGDGVKVTLDKAGAPIDAVFLGRFVGVDGKATDGAFYEAATDRMHFLPLTDLRMERADGSQVDMGNTFPLVKPVKQHGSTCSSFADFNCLLTIRERTGQGVPLTTEAQRLFVLSRMLSDTYQNHFGNGISRFSALLIEGSLTMKREEMFVPKGELKKPIVEALEEGWPVILHFDNRSWSSQPFKTIQYAGADKPAQVGGHGQWLPMKKPLPFSGLRKFFGMKLNDSRHAVVLLGVVEGPKGSRKLLVLDANWDYPVLWDMSELDHGVQADFKAIKFSWAPKPVE